MENGRKQNIKRKAKSALDGCGNNAATAQQLQSCKLIHSELVFGLLKDGGNRKVGFGSEFGGLDDEHVNSTSCRSESVALLSWTKFAVLVLPCPRDYKTFVRTSSARMSRTSVIKYDYCKTALSKLVGGRSLSSSGKGKSYEGLIKYGFSLIKGKANHPMEDYHVAKFVQTQEDGGHELGLFAIYDGHLGDTVPAYLQKHLFSNILKEEEFWVDPIRSISKAYERTDQAILSHSSDLGRGGSTAVTAILLNGRRLWVANVGDSRAVLSRGGQAIQMSTDHEPSTERGSIENKGGFVSNMPDGKPFHLKVVPLTFINDPIQLCSVLDSCKADWDVPRVNGQLAVSRAFGDKSLKLHLRSDPDIQVADIDDTAEMLILASDGLWKVMSNQEAVDIARRIKDPLKAAKQLTTEALRRDSKDDISCVVVRFRG
ncbi:hypothetical protein Tsubulata_022970 [Turnera subulata]|uniref:PPM-type phosphatase domain-containing protein n=1 Tax=Turnera subulata TaxID=218843 RepID=A0A9Q0G007_9ROSI|nr:hypothetical protein Tsubulata_022970 [Turnera subulata]